MSWSLLPEDARKEKIRAVAGAHDPDQNETREVPWKGSSHLCPVVSVPLETAVLNPKSHRIRSELESHPEATRIQADPFSAESQGVIADILRDTEGFAALKESLHEEGQRDHGVTTESGLLVNANTRAVALNDLGKTHIKVALLPTDAGEKEISQLELSLQMQRDLKQDYTFTNELLFVDDLISNFQYANQQVAKLIRREERDVEQFTRLLALVREIQRRSGGKVPLKFFDEDKEQLLKDLDQSYQRLRESDPDSAVRLRDTRILGVLAGTYYRDLRFADEHFAEEYLAEALADNEQIGASVTELLHPKTSAEDDEEVEGVDELLGEDAVAGDVDGDGVSVAALVNLLATTFGDEAVELPAEDGPQQVEREQVKAAVYEAIAEAAEEAKADKKKERGLTGPIVRLKDARKSLRKVKTEYRAVAGDENFNHGAFEYEASKLQGDVDAVKAEIERRER
ncbi:MAG: hypothetical protein M3454_01420 [Actinomycetota bacterium]|nr:hypothetical protein [Actinomycetota bacterium]